MKETSDPRDTPHHPRRRAMLLGHARAEETLLHAYRGGRLHHAWLIGGRRGIGKATLAYRFARFLLRHPDPAGVAAGSSLAIDPTDPVFHRVAAGAHPDLFVIERPFDQKTEKVKAETNVDVARAATGFFGRTAGEGGWRVCIVDSADDLNLEAANSLLKIIEEPPPRSIFLIVAHAPGRVLRTIRSRSIRLGLEPLEQPSVVDVVRSVLSDELPPQADVTLAAELSRGSPGRAFDLLRSSGARIFSSFRHLVSDLPNLDVGATLGFADQLQVRTAGEDFAAFCELLSDWIAERARAATEEARPDAGRWAEVHCGLAHSIRIANALNLDRRQLVMHAFEAIQDAARHDRT